MKKNNYVLNTTDGLTYQITTDKIQTRNRRQVRGTTIRNVKHTRIASNNLRYLTDFEASICMTAEKIIRNKKAMTETQATIVSLSRILKKNIA